jgi:transcriptional regulator with XRE-family HTH domain
MDFFGRLREERARLGLSQQQVADAASVHVKTVRRWESHVAMPLDAMIPLLTIGYDVQYVASGVRSRNIHEVREKGVDYEVEPGIAGDEIALLRRYRMLTLHQREQALAVLAVLALKLPLAVRESRAMTAAAKAIRDARTAATAPSRHARIRTRTSRDGS